MMCVCVFMSVWVCVCVCVHVVQLFVLIWCLSTPDNLELFVSLVFPVVVTQPLQTSATAGLLANLSCTVRGFPAVDIVWRKGNQYVSDIDNGYVETVITLNETLTKGVLTIQSPDRTHEGNYSCNASNFLITAESDVSSMAELFVLCE